MPPRTPRPHPHLEPEPPAADPAPVRDPPQPAPAPPLPARRSTNETTTRTGRSRAVPRPKTTSHRRHDQRISPGRMTWTGFSAPSLPLTGLLTLGSGPARFQTEPPACYRASRQLPGPDFHRQATTSLRTRRNTMALRHGVTSRSAGRTKEATL